MSTTTRTIGDATIYIGDCLNSLRAMPDVSIQTCVTSPPYFGLRDYGMEGQLGLEQTPEEFIAKMVEVFREVRRVLRDDGTLWVNIGDSYARDSRVRWDSTIHTDKEWKVNQAMRNAPNLIRDGEGYKPKDLIGIPWMLAFALRADGWYLRQDIIWNKPNPMPESVRDRCTKSHEYIFLLSKGPRYYFDSEAMKEPAVADKGTARPASSKADAGADRTTNGSPRHRMALDGIRDVARRPHAPRATELSAYLLASATAAGHTYKSVAAQLGLSDERVRHYFRTDEAGARLPEPDVWEAMKEMLRLDGRYDEKMRVVIGDNESRPDGFRNRRSVWTVATRPYKGAHFATFPPALIEPCILAGSRPGDIVLDPFLGSGTTAAVALQHGRKAVGLELNPAYVELAAERIEATRRVHTAASNDAKAAPVDAANESHAIQDDLFASLAAN